MHERPVGIRLERSEGALFWAWWRVPKGDRELRVTGSVDPLQLDRRRDLHVAAVQPAVVLGEGQRRRGLARVACQDGEAVLPVDHIGPQQGRDVWGSCGWVEVLRRHEIFDGLPARRSSRVLIVLGFPQELLDLFFVCLPIGNLVRV